MVVTDIQESNMKDGDKEFIVCECESLEHIACLTFWDDNVVVDDEGTEMNRICKKASHLVLTDRA